MEALFSSSFQFRSSSRSRSLSLSLFFFACLFTANCGISKQQQQRKPQYIFHKKKEKKINSNIRWKMIYILFLHKRNKQIRCQLISMVDKISRLKKMRTHTYKKAAIRGSQCVSSTVIVSSALSNKSH